MSSSTSRIVSRTLAGIVVALVFGAVSDEVSAQNASRDFNRNFYYNRPTVSPYLNLITQAQSTGFAPIYQNVVRPQMEAREAQLRQDSDISRIQSQLSQMRADYGRQQNQSGQVSTGHPSRFMTYLHYYPTMGMPQR